MRLYRHWLVVAAQLLISCQTGVGQTQSAAPAGSGAPDAVTLFENVRVFDGKSNVVSAPSNVLVRGNKIDKISTSPIATNRRADTKIIEGGGRTLMPGLI